MNLAIYLWFSPRAAIKIRQKAAVIANGLGIQDAQACRNDLEKQQDAVQSKLETYQSLLLDGEDINLEQTEKRKEGET